MSVARNVAHNGQPRASIPTLVTWSASGKGRNHTRPGEVKDSHPGVALVIYGAMWLTLDTSGAPPGGVGRRLTLVDEQAIWPASESEDLELVIKLRAQVTEEIILVTPRIARLRYEVESLTASMTLGDQAPTPWPEASELAGRRFELMLSDRGPLVIPSPGTRLPPRLASWLGTVSEDIRSCWPVPPAGIQVGTEWDLLPVVPGGMPAGTASLSLRAAYRVEDMSEDRAAVAAAYTVVAHLEPTASSRAGAKLTTRAEGHGDLRVELHQSLGCLKAERVGRMELSRRGAARSQTIRSTMHVDQVEIV